MVLGLLFPCIALIGLLWNSIQTNIETVLNNASVNGLLLLIQMLFILLYFLIKNEKKSLKQKLGPGDILFLLSCCFLFSPFNFILFYIISLLFSLLLHLLFLQNSYYTKHHKTVALAGWQACFLVLTILIVSIMNKNLYSDNWILKYLYNE
jgi:hypothetical protein